MLLKFLKIKICFKHGGAYIFWDETKNGKARTVSIAPSIVSLLRRQQTKQAEWKLAAGPLWSNPRNLVFTDEVEGHLKHHTVYNHFKSIVRLIGLEETRFHDLRHSWHCRTETLLKMCRSS